MHAAEALGPESPVQSQAGCCRGAYDGRGNAVVNEAADAEAAVSRLGGYEQGLYAERWEYFVKV